MKQNVLVFVLHWFSVLAKYEYMSIYRCFYNPIFTDFTVIYIFFLLQILLRGYPEHGPEHPKANAAQTIVGHHLWIRTRRSGGSRGSAGHHSVLHHTRFPCQHRLVAKGYDTCGFTDKNRSQTNYASVGALYHCALLPLLRHNVLSMLNVFVILFFSSWSYW